MRGAINLSPGFRRVFRSRILRHLLTTPSAMFGIALVVAFTLVAAFAPMLAPPVYKGNPYMMPRASYVNEPLPPGPGHPLGTTTGQYDMYYGIVWGTRTAFRVGLIVTSAIAAIGIIVGSLAAFYGGVLDEVVMRVVDIFMTMPFLVAAMVVVTILGQGLGKVMIALIAFGWMGYARVVRGEVKSVREFDYVQAARALGASDLRILFRHVLPNAIFPIFVMVTMDIGSMVLTAAAMSFLGLGSELGYADWGQLISFARNWIPRLNEYWWIVLYPSLAILLFVLAWNLVGDALRDILDPRLRGRITV